MVFMLQILLRPFLAILDSCLISMLRNSNPRLPLWLGVLMFRIKILLILVWINTMIVVLILGDILMRDDYKRYLNESSTRSEKSQLDIYLEEPELELNSQIDVLDYWSKSSVRYNELSLLARDLLAIPISTVTSESAFSMSKKVIIPLRSSLKPKTVQAVVCLGDWMQAKGFSAEISCKKDDEDDGDDEDDDDDDVSSVAF